MNISAEYVFEGQNYKFAIGPRSRNSRARDINFYEHLITKLSVVALVYSAFGKTVLSIRSSVYLPSTELPIQWPRYSQLNLRDVDVFELLLHSMVSSRLSERLHCNSSANLNAVYRNFVIAGDSTSSLYLHMRYECLSGDFHAPCGCCFDMSPRPRRNTLACEDEDGAWKTAGDKEPNR